MKVKCTCDCGFEDMLTADKEYSVIATNGAGTEYQITGDDGKSRWFGSSKFHVVSDLVVVVGQD